jgi:O-antigen/teichoic acid export membrane protein
VKFISKYITNISSLQFIQLLRFSVLFLIGIVFSRYYTKSTIGEYEILIFVASAISFFWLRGVLQTFMVLVKPDKSLKTDSYFNVTLLMLVFSIIIVIFLIAFKTSIGKLLNVDTIPYFNWLILYILFSSPSYIIEYIFLTQDRSKSVIIYGLVSYGIQFVLLIVPPLLSLDIEYSIMGLVFVNIARFIYLLAILTQYSRYKISIPFIKKYIILAYPLIGSALLSGSSQYIDGLLVTKFFDTSVFAIFRYGARELPLVVILANALSNSMIYDFSNTEISKALHKLKKNAKRLMHLLFPTTLFFIIISNWIYIYFFTEEFAQSAKIFNIYLLLVIPRLLFPQTILIGKHYTKSIFWVSFAEVIVNIFLSYILIQQWGLTGVAIATIIANLFERLTLMLIVKIKFNTKISDYISVKWYIFYSIVTLVVFYIVDYEIFIRY